MVQARELARHVAACVVAAATLYCAGAAAQSVKLRVADSFPVGHFVPEYATKFWMAEAKRLSNGTLDFEYYPAEQLGKSKDMLSLVQTGVADVSFVSPAYISDKLPLSGLVELPFGYGSACVGTRAFWSIARNGGVLAQREFGPLGVRLVFAMMFPPNQIVLSKPGFEGLRSLEGLKIRTSGGAKDQLLRRINAVPIQMAGPEIREAMSRGTIDGLMIPVASLMPYELEKLSKVATVGENFGAFIVTYAISEARWQNLTPTQQNAIMEAGEATTRRACELMERDDAKHYDKLRALGVTLVRLSPQDKQLVDNIASGIAQDWAEQADKRGKAGTEVLRAFVGALK
jgi:TRAP-type C4-dicarboxylate transport system substrate-binding protein